MHIHDCTYRTGCIGEKTAVGVNCGLLTVNVVPGDTLQIDDWEHIPAYKKSK